MNNKAKLLITSVVASSLLVVSAAPALAADTQAKPSFWDKIMLGMGFKKQLSADKKDARIAQMKAKHEQRLNDRLSAAVSSGKITQDKSDALKLKLQAIEDIKALNAGKTKQEKRDAIKSAREELRTWASQNGINLADIMPTKPAKTQ